MVQGLRGNHDWNYENQQEKLDFHSVGRLLRSTIRFGSRNAAMVQNPLIKGKDFNDNVEAHESTCDTWPTSGAGASEYGYGNSEHEYGHE